MPPKNKNHKLGGIDLILRSVFDDYAIEYGEFFAEQLDEFDEKLEALKREIQIA